MAHMNFGAILVNFRITWSPQINGNEISIINSLSIPYFANLSGNFLKWNGKSTRLASPTCRAGRPDLLLCYHAGRHRRIPGWLYSRFGLPVAPGGQPQYARFPVGATSFTGWPIFLQFALLKRNPRRLGGNRESDENDRSESLPHADPGREPAPGFDARFLGTGRHFAAGKLRR